MSFLIYPTPKLMPIQGLTGFGGGATGLANAGGAAAEMTTNGLIIYWNAIAANVSGEYISDTSGNGWSDLEAKWTGASSSFNSSRNGGAFECPSNSTANNYFDVGNSIIFGTGGGGSNQGTEFTFFIGGQWHSGKTNGYAMFFTGQDSNNFIGQGGNGFWRMDSNQDKKADADAGTDEDIGTGIAVVYFSMTSSGLGRFYLNGARSGGNALYDGGIGGWTGDNIIINSMNAYSSTGPGMVYASAHYLFFAGVYNRVLEDTEIADNYLAHQQRLGI